MIRFETRLIGLPVNWGKKAAQITQDVEVIRQGLDEASPSGRGMIRRHRLPLQRCCQRLALAFTWTASLNAVSAMAEPVSMKADKLLHICVSKDVQIASHRGDALGWSELTVDEKENWIGTYIAYNAQSVELVGWQKSQGEQHEYLLFWANSRSNSLKTCSYSSSNVGSLLENLTVKLGSAHSSDRNDAKENITIRWLQSDVEYSFVQVRSKMIVTIGAAR